MCIYVSQQEALRSCLVLSSTSSSLILLFILDFTLLSFIPIFFFSHLLFHLDLSVFFIYFSFSIFSIFYLFFILFHWYVFFSFHRRNFSLIIFFLGISQATNAFLLFFFLFLPYIDRLLFLSIIIFFFHGILEAQDYTHF